MVAVLVGGSLLSWRYWGSLHGGEDSVSTTVRNLGLVIGGVIAVLLAVWRSLVATRQADTAQHQTSIARQGLLNERYQKAAEMLGNENLFVRLGGVYALQALIEEHPEQYYVSCMRLLCALVRNPPADLNLPSLSDREMTRSGGGIRLRGDVQAVMDIMRSRDDRLTALERKASFVVDFRGADLRGSNLRSVNFTRVDLRDADLSGGLCCRVKYVGRWVVGSETLQDQICIGESVRRPFFGRRRIQDLVLRQVVDARPSFRLPRRRHCLP